jgi:hypothetical protein
LVQHTRPRAFDGFALPTVNPNIDHLLRTAIAETKLVRLRYRNRDRIVEPHDYGEHNGTIKVLAYQAGGSSSGPLPNWRWMEADHISDLRLLDQTFPGGRPLPRANTTNGTSCSPELNPLPKRRSEYDIAQTRWRRVSLEAPEEKVVPAAGPPFKLTNPRDH